MVLPVVGVEAAPLFSSRLLRRLDGDPRQRRPGDAGGSRPSKIGGQPPPPVLIGGLPVVLAEGEEPVEALHLDVRDVREAPAELGLARSKS